MNINNLRIKAPERILLINSHYVKEELPWLHSLLVENPRITYKVISELSKEQQNFIDNMLNYTLRQASSEWKEDKKFEDLGENDELWINCSLCGKKNRYIHYIRNQLTNKLINVGSDCVTEYAIDRDKAHMSKAQLIKEARKNRRMVDINESFPGLIQQINRWDQHLQSFQIIIPNSLANPYKNIGNEIKKLYEDFINEKVNKEVFPSIQLVLERASVLLQEIESYVELNRDKKFVPSIRLANWLKREHEDTTLNWLQEDGIIKWRTIHRIFEPNFMKELLADLTSISDFNALFLQVVEDKKGYVYIFKDYDDIQFFVKHEQLLLTFGGLLFQEKTDEEVNSKNLLRMSDVYKGPQYLQSIRSLTTLIYSKMSKPTFSYIDEEEFNNSYFDTEFNEIYLSRNKRVLAVNLQDYLRLCKSYLFADVNEGEIESLIRKKSNEYSKQEFFDYIERMNEIGRLG